MKRFLNRALVLVMLLSCCGVFSLRAQQMPPLPADTAVRIGQLPNGLTYYIRHNNTPKGQADFYIAQKVGSILENDNQRGLAHFLEHMCFNGTTNFPEKGIINWLESIGVKFGQNLNAYTGVDETVYNISNVPVARKSVQDSCLLILHDWACDLTLDPKEIDAERGVIHEEWRQSMKGNMRIIEKILPTVYPDSKYGHRLPIGTMEIVDNFPPKDLVDYYHTWYRPDQQGIIVVGDIDVDYIEGKIKEMFSSIPMPANAPERVYLDVADNDGTIYAIGSDPEMQVPVFLLMFKSDVLPKEMRNTMAYYIQKYAEAMLASMLNSRFNELALNPDCPFAGASAGFGEFFLAKTKDAFQVQGVAKGGDIAQAYEAIYRELLRAARGGFTQSEYDRAKAEFMSRIERLYNERNNTQTAVYVQEYVDNFLDGDPIPGIEIDYQLYQQISAMLPLQLMNQLIGESITDDNRVLIVMMPEGEGYTNPTEQQLADITAKVNAETIEAHVDNTKTEPLIPALPAAGKIVAEKKLDQWDATELTLSNGVRVIVKPTDFKDNQIIMNAIALGGTSTISDDMAATMRMLPYSLETRGAYNYTSNDIEKYLAGKQVGIGLTFDDYMRDITGTTTVKDLPVMMELLYAYFTGLKIDETEFASLQAQLKAVFANQANTPEFIFQTDMQKAMYKSPKKQMLALEDIDLASQAATEQIARQMLANAADYTFVFVGKIDMDNFRPLVEQYIATLPADAAKTVKTVAWDPALEAVPGTATNQFTTAMQTPTTYVYLNIGAKLPYDAKTRVLSTVAAQILSKRLLNKVREEMGAVYSIGMGGSMSRVGEYNTQLMSVFPTKPEMKDETLQVVHDIIYSATADVTEDELAPVREFMVKQAKTNAEENDGWAGTIAATQINGVDVWNGQIDLINSLTVDDVKNFMKQLLDQNNYRVVVLDPAN